MRRMFTCTRFTTIYPQNDVGAIMRGTQEPSLRTLFKLARRQMLRPNQHFVQVGNNSREGNTHNEEYRTNMLIHMHLTLLCES